MNSQQKLTVQCAEGMTNSRIIRMAKEKVSISVDGAVLAAADADAKAAGLNRSELIERALRNEHLRISLETYKNLTVPALQIDEYAQRLYGANRSAGL